MESSTGISSGATSSSTQAVRSVCGQHGPTGALNARATFVSDRSGTRSYSAAASFGVRLDGETTGQACRHDDCADRDVTGRDRPPVRRCQAGQSVLRSPRWTRRPSLISGHGDRIKRIPLSMYRKSVRLPAVGWPGTVQHRASHAQGTRASALRQRTGPSGSPHARMRLTAEEAALCFCLPG